jgi:phage gp46-like protein
MFNQELTIIVSGQTVDTGMVQTDPLVRAVLLSLFTWRRANAGDVLPGEQKMGWCGDSLSPIAGDRFGSRLWLLARAKLVAETFQQAKDYAKESLQWLIDDGVCARIEVTTERLGREGLAMGVIIYRNDSSVLLDLRFADVWSVITRV